MNQNNNCSSGHYNSSALFTEPIDYKCVCDTVDAISKQNDFLRIINIGKSIFGKNLICIRLGSGPQNILYVAAHHGMEWITSAVLLKFADDFCNMRRLCERVYNYSLSYFLETRSVYIIPMLNPDGVDMSLHGLPSSNVIVQRLIRMNGGSDDFSHWQANGRGVDLNHNYNAGFREYKAIEAENRIYGGAPTRYSGEYPESEPEVAAVTNFIRMLGDVRLLITLHSQGEEIYWSYNGASAPNSYRIARKMSDLSGYKISEASGMSSFGGMKDWFISEYNRPGFTIECGLGENPLPIRDYTGIYSSLREILFTAPFML